MKLDTMYNSCTKLQAKSKKDRKLKAFSPVDKDFLEQFYDPIIAPKRYSIAKNLFTRHLSHKGYTQMKQKTLAKLSRSSLRAVTYAIAQGQGILFRTRRMFRSKDGQCHEMASIFESNPAISEPTLFAWLCEFFKVPKYLRNSSFLTVAIGIVMAFSPVLMKSFARDNLYIRSICISRGCVVGICPHRPPTDYSHLHAIAHEVEQEAQKIDQWANNWTDTLDSVLPIVPDGQPSVQASHAEETVNPSFFITKQQNSCPTVTANEAQLKERLMFSQEQLTELASYPTEAIKHADARYKAAIAAGKPVTNVFNYYKAVAQGYMDDQAKKQSAVASTSAAMHSATKGMYQRMIQERDQRVFESHELPMLKKQVDSYSRAVAAASKTYARTRTDVDFRFLEDAQTQLKYFTRKMHETAAAHNIDLATIKTPESLPQPPVNHPDVQSFAAYLGNIMPDSVKQELAALKRSGHDDPRLNNPVLEVILKNTPSHEQRSFIGNDSTIGKPTILKQ